MPWPWRRALSGQRVAAAGLRPRAGTEPGLVQALAPVNALLRQGGGDMLPIRFQVAQPHTAPPALGDDESYRLQIAPQGVTVRARRLCGARHALTTLRQLAAHCRELPVGRIEDRPRFAWRGLMLDVARRFLSPAALRDVIEVMAFYKLNVLHLHLSDDQGFRFGSDAYPRLASADSYSGSQLRELVDAAARRGIRVVPELDMPGHVTSWLAAYPGWAPRRARNAGRDGLPGARSRAPGEAGRAFATSRRFGPHPAVLNVADEAVYAVIDSLLEELASVFPDTYVHIGGDEVLPGWWEQSTEVRSFMRRHGLADAVALQAHFNARVAAMAARHGKQTVGWDEVLNGGAPGGMAVQAWRGATAQHRALAAGHACIESSGYYLDLNFPADVHHAWNPGAPLGELLEREDALLADPRFRHVADGMRWAHRWRDTESGTASAASDGSEEIGATAGRLLGGEACLWSELVDERLLPVRLWSRMPAIAERLWSLQAPPENVAGRLQASLDRQAACGLVDVRQTSRRLLLEFGVREAQLDAVELLEPVKWYGRLLGEVALRARIEGSQMPMARPYRADTPLDRPVDALLPESFAARRFARLLRGDQTALRRECGRLASVCETGNFVEDLEAAMERLAGVLAAVLDVLHGRIDESAALDAVTAAAEPAGEYIVAIAPAVLAWLRAR